MRFGFNAHAKPPEAYFDYAVEHRLEHIEIDLIKVTLLWTHLMMSESTSWSVWRSRPA